MKTSTLSKLLHIIQEADSPLSLNEIARELAVSPARLAGMLDYWVRRERIREVVVGEYCGPCGARGSCLLMTGQPRRYELVPLDGYPREQAVTMCCPGAQPDPAATRGPGALWKRTARDP